MAKIILVNDKLVNWKVQIGNKKMYLWGSPPSAQIGIVKEMISKDKFKKLFINDMNNQIKGYKSYSKNNWKSLREDRDKKEAKEAIRDFKKIIAIGEQLKKDAQKDPTKAFIKLQGLRNRGFGMAKDWNNSYDLITADKTMGYISSLGDKKAKKMRLEKNRKKAPAKKRKAPAKRRKTPAKKRKAPAKRRKAPAKKKAKARKKRPSPSISATSVKAGTRRRGGSGKMYVAKRYTINGKRIQRWVKA